MDVPAARAWDIIADVSTYQDWVVGASRVRGTTGEWPEVGANFHHVVGVWPLHIRDRTEVLEVEPPRRILMLAHFRPVGSARIELVVEPDGAACEVTMTEQPVGPTPMALLGPLVDPLLSLRNVESLRRLEAAARRLEDR